MIQRREDGDIREQENLAGRHRFRQRTLNEAMNQRNQERARDGMHRIQNRPNNLAEYFDIDEQIVTGVLFVSDHLRVRWAAELAEFYAKPKRARVNLN